MEKINKQRKEYLNWDQYFMGVAKLSALRSKDPSTQVGACIVGDDNRMVLQMVLVIICSHGIGKVNL